MNEVWRKVVSSGDYEVSNFGRFRRASGGRGARAGHILKWHTNTSSGYATVRFTSQGKQITKIVHNVVCEAFHGPKPVGMLVRHLDGNKLNNSVDNLAYGTALDNAADMLLHGRYPRGEKHHKAKLSFDNVNRIKADYGFGFTAKALSRQYGVSQSTIYRVVSGRSWKQNASNRAIDRAAS